MTDQTEPTRLPRLLPRAEAIENAIAWAHSHGYAHSVKALVEYDQAHDVVIYFQSCISQPQFAGPGKIIGKFELSLTDWVIREEYDQAHDARA